MDFYQSIVAEYLQRNRACFLNTEFYIVDRKHRGEEKREWFVDIVAMDMRYHRVWLCEISYAQQLTDLFKRLQYWSSNWLDISDRVRFEACLPDALRDWPVYVWIFVPPADEEHGSRENNIMKMQRLKFGDSNIRVTRLNEVAPWLDNRWPKDWQGKDIEESELKSFPGA